METTEPPDQSEPVGLVWNSAVDPARINTETSAPGFSEAGVDLTLDMVVSVPGDHESCRENADAAFEPPPEGVESCLFLQWRFNNSPDNAGTTYVSVDVIVSPEGRQYEPLAWDSTDARPGTVDNLGLAVFPNAGPGSTVYFTGAAESSDGDFNTIEQALKIPVDGYLPVGWFDF